MATISVEELKPGMVLSQDVRDPLGRLLVAAGTVTTPRHAEILKKWGISVVEIESDDDSQGAEVTPEILEKAKESLRPRFRRVDLEHPFMEELFAQCAERLAKKLAEEETSGR